ncbi:hypothetical protein CMEL01_07544 [Colletotrichum melonis]|uniref:Uncharacterized protein n=1 Tax=Colletotrichum melonis TaxID=1209925 RepID=A0AAI9U255_9PEZI|nr:hypothetical protein CMEL01_07544 [Colletotrichum melonis]
MWHRLVLLPYPSPRRPSDSQSLVSLSLFALFMSRPQNLRHPSRTSLTVLGLLRTNTAGQYALVLSFPRLHPLLLATTSTSAPTPARTSLLHTDTSRQTTLTFPGVAAARHGHGPGSGPRPESLTPTLPLHLSAPSPSRVPSPSPSHTRLEEYSTLKKYLSLLARPVAAFQPASTVISKSLHFSGPSLHARVPT